VRRHQLDPFSLVFGATFALVGSLFLFARVDVATLHLKWVWPIPLIVVGVLIIGLAARSEARREELEDR
jgi:hypothetical protein